MVNDPEEQRSKCDGNDCRSRAERPREGKKFPQLLKQHLFGSMYVIST